MTFLQFLSILRARWMVVIGVLVATVALVFGMSMMSSKKYAATASVVLDVKPDPVAAMLNQGTSSPTVMATQVDVMRSDRVGFRVARNLHLADNPQVRSQWQAETGGRGTIEQWLNGTFQRGLEVTPSRESNVINVTFRATDPKFAAALANAFVQAYLEIALELRVDPARQYSSFFDSRVKEARENLEKAQARVSAYQNANGIIATEERYDVENTRLNELSSQLVAVQALSYDSSSRQAQAANGSAERMQEVLSNPVISGLKGDLSRAEAKLQELNAKFGVNHPLVVEAKASIADLRSKYAAEMARVTGGVGVSANINRQREAEIRASVEAQRAKILKMKATRDEGMVLQRDVENAQRAYESVQQRLNQTSLESQTTQSNAVLLSPADVPLSPTSRVALYTTIALFVGALLGVFVALLLEILDRRVRGAEDVVVALGLPVIGVMPRPNARRLFGKPAPSATAMQRRLLGQSGFKQVNA